MCATNYKCEDLTDLVLGKSVAILKENVFKGCSGLKNITIPASLIVAEDSTFYDAKKIETVNYLATSPQNFGEDFFYRQKNEVDGMFYVGENNKEATLNAPNISNAAQFLSYETWRDFKTKHVGSETGIVSDVFEVDNLKYNIFRNTPPQCQLSGKIDGYSAKEINIPEKVNYNGINYEVVRINNGAFMNDQVLEKITLPDKIFAFATGAFYDCQNLKEINMPKSLTSIGARAFYNCQMLDTIVLPDGVERINSSAFRECRGLEYIRIPDGLKELGDSALYYCSHLKKIDRTDNWKLNRIGNYALANCNELDAITIPKTTTYIGKKAFFECDQLKELLFPTSVAYIGDHAFDSCHELVTVRFFRKVPPVEVVYKEGKNDTVVRKVVFENTRCRVYVPTQSLADYRKKFDTGNNEHYILPAITIAKPKSIPRYTGEVNFEYSLKDFNVPHTTQTWATTNPIVADFSDSSNSTLRIYKVGGTTISVVPDNANYKNKNIDGNFYYDDHQIKVYPQTADANWDGTFTISDAVNIAQYSLQNETSLTNWMATRSDFTKLSTWNEFYFKGADVNGDKSISVSDVSAAVKIILKQPINRASEQSKIRAASTRGNGGADALVVGTAENSVGVITIPITLDNSMEYVALQADIQTPKGMKLKDVKVGSRVSGHTLITNRFDDHTMRVVLFDFGNSAFADSDEPLFSLVVDDTDLDLEDIEIFNIFASDFASNNYELTSYSVATEGSINEVETLPEEDVSDFVHVSKGELTITGTEGKPIAIFTLEGHTLHSFTASDDTVTVTLSSGFYIVAIENKSTKIAIK